MTTQLQLRRGTTAQNASFTGAVGELTFDTQTKSIFAHDGSTQGGIKLAKSSDLNAYTKTTAPLRLFRRGADSTGTMSGYIDDFRVTKDIARYTGDSSFTPPTAPFSLT